MVDFKRLSLDSILDKTPLRESFANKVLATCLFASLAPTLLVSALLLSSTQSMSQQAQVFWIVTVVLAAAAFTVWGIRSLLRPLKDLTSVVDNFVSTGELSQISTAPDDELGLLMRETRNVLLKLDLSTKELSDVSKVDVLTGLPNRRFCSHRLKQDLARADRGRIPVSLIAVDVDDFKRLNERFGMTVGDVCLQYFADIAKTCIRDGDWIARWGGDEFLILLWDADSRQADLVIDRIRWKLAQSEITHEAGIRLTASFGYTSHCLGETNYDLFAKADSALHRAKRLGKNQSVSSSSLKAP